MRSIIGITGAFGSGKSTAATLIEREGYKKVYLSSYLELEAKKRKLPLTRKVLQDLGNEMRESQGSGVLMQRALQDLRNENKIVVDGLRNLGEVTVLKKQKGSVLLSIMADREVRFNRLRLLKRREKLTPKLFERLDLRDLGVNEKITGLQTAFCIALADVYIDSNSTMDVFEAKILNFLNKYGS